MNDKERLNNLVEFARGGGFGDPEAKAQHDREIQFLQFKISQKNNFKIGMVAALIGALTSSLVGLLINFAFD